MSSTTYLQMVNRIRRRGRHGDDASVSSGDELSVVLGDLLNEAKREVLESREWDFDIRHDAPLKVFAAETTASAGLVVADSAGVGVVGVTSATTINQGTMVARFVATDAANYSSTPFRITHAENITNDLYTLETTWPGATDLGAATLLYVNEYVLPATVGDVLGVKFNEDDVNLTFVDKLEELDRVYPRLFDTQSSEPEVIYVGGSSTPTVDVGETGTPGLGLWIYPVPSEAYVLQYTYRYRHADLSSDTDTLSGVPEHIVDIIVERAFESALATKVFNDVRLSETVANRVQRRLTEAQREDRSDPNRRMAMMSHDRRRGPGIPIGSRPKNPRVFYTE